MFDLIEEELSDEKKSIEQEPQFKESDNPIYTMPTTYRKERGIKGSDKKLIVIIFGSLFGLAAIGTGVFLFLSRSAPEPPSSPPAPMQQTQEEQKGALSPSPAAEPQPTEEQQPSPTTIEQQQKEEQKTVPSTPTTPVSEIPETTTPLLGIDADQDGLTENEERLYSTDPQKGDTDGDTYLDGDELKNLYDPLRGEQARLDVSGLVNTYTNQTFQYSLLYPSSWVAQSTDRTDREVMISSATGEFFTITASENPNKLSPVDWYASQAAPGSDTSRLQSFTYETWSGVMTPDSLTVYVTRNDAAPEKQTVIYTLNYSLGTKNEINFISTMQMMLKSFVFTDLSFVK